MIGALALFFAFFSGATFSLFLILDKIYKTLAGILCLVLAFMASISLGLYLSTTCL